MSSPFIGAYWGVREETAGDCALRAANLVKRIGKHHELLSCWFEKGRSVSEALENRLDPSQEAFLKLFGNKDENDISTTGFNLGIWNGNPSLSMSFTMTCGGVLASIKNCAVLRFPPGCDESVFMPADLNQLMSEFSEVLDPEIVTFTSHEHIREKGGGRPWEVGGWITHRFS